MCDNEPNEIDRDELFSELREMGGEFQRRSSEGESDYQLIQEDFKSQLENLKSYYNETLLIRQEEIECLRCTGSQLREQLALKEKDMLEILQRHENQIISLYDETKTKNDKPNVDEMITVMKDQMKNLRDVLQEKQDQLDNTNKKLSEQDLIVRQLQERNLQLEEEAKKYEPKECSDQSYQSHIDQLNQTIKENSKQQLKFKAKIKSLEKQLISSKESIFKETEKMKDLKNELEIREKIIDKQNILIEELRQTEENLRQSLNRSIATQEEQLLELKYWEKFSEVNPDFEKIYTQQSFSTEPLKLAIESLSKLKLKKQELSKVVTQLNLYLENLEDRNKHSVQLENKLKLLNKSLINTNKLNVNLNKHIGVLINDYKNFYQLLNNIDSEVESLNIEELHLCSNAELIRKILTITSQAYTYNDKFINLEQDVLRTGLELNKIVDLCVEACPKIESTFQDIESFLDISADTKRQTPPDKNQNETESIYLEKIFSNIYDRNVKLKLQIENHFNEINRKNDQVNQAFQNQIDALLKKEKIEQEDKINILHKFECGKEETIEKLNNANLKIQSELEVMNKNDILSKEELTKLKEQNEIILIESRSLKEINMKLQKEIDEKYSNELQLKVESENIRSCHDCIMKQLKECDINVQNVTDESEKSNLLIEKLRMENKELHQDLEMTRINEMKLTENICLLSSDNEIIIKELDLLQNRIINIEKEVEERRSKDMILKAFEEENNEMKIEVEQLINENKHFEETVEIKKNIMEKLEKEIKEKSNNESSLIAELKTVGEDRDRLINDLKECEKNISTLKKDSEANKLLINKLQTENKKFQDDVEIMCNNEIKLKEELLMLTEEKSIIVNESEIVKENIINIKEELERTIEEKDCIMKECNELKDNVSKLEKRNEEMNMNIENLNNEKENLLKDLTEKRNIESQLQKDIENINAIKESLSKEIKILKNETEKLEIIKESELKLQNDLKVLTSEKDKQIMELECMKDQMTTFKKETEQCRFIIKTLEEEQIKRQQEFEETNNNVIKVKDELLGSIEKKEITLRELELLKSKTLAQEKRIEENKEQELKLKEELFNVKNDKEYILEQLHDLEQKALIMEKEKDEINLILENVYNDNLRLQEDVKFFSRNEIKLKDDFSKFTIDNEKVINQLKLLNERVIEMEKEVEERRCRELKLTKNSQRIMKDMRDVEVKMVIFEKENSEMKVKIDALETENIKLKQDSELKLKEEIINFETQNQFIEKESKIVKDLVLKLKEELHDKNNTELKLKDEFENVREGRDRIKNDFEELGKKFLILTNDLEKCNLLIDELRMENKQQHQDLEMTRINEMKLTENICLLSSDNEIIIKELDLLQNRIINIEKEVEERRSKDLLLKAFEEENNEMKIEVEQLINKNKHFEETVEIKKNIMEKLEKEIKEKSNNESSLIDELKTVGEDRDLLINDLKECEKNISTLTKDSEANKLLINKLQTENKKFQDDVEIMCNNEIKLKEELLMLTEEKSIIVNESEIVKENIINIKEELERTREENDCIMKECNELKDNVSKLEKRNDEMNMNIENLNNEKDNLLKEIEKLEIIKESELKLQSDLKVLISEKEKQTMELEVMKDRLVVIEKEKEGIVAVIRNWRNKDIEETSNVEGEILLQEELKFSTENTPNIKTLIEDLINKSARLEKEKMKYEGEIKSFNDEKILLNEGVYKLKSDFLNCKENLVNITTEKDVIEKKLKDELYEEKFRVDNLNTQMETFTQTIKELSAIGKMSEENTTEITVEKINIIDEISDIKDKLNSFEKLKKENKQILKSLNENNALYQNKIHEMTEKEKQLNEKLTEAISDRDKLKEEIANVNSLAASLGNEKTDSYSMIEELNHQLSFLKSEMRRMNTREAELSEDILLLRKENSCMMEEMDTLKNNLLTSELEKSERNDENMLLIKDGEANEICIIKLKEEVKHLLQKITTLEQDLELLQNNLAICEKEKLDEHSLIEDLSYQLEMHKKIVREMSSNELETKVVLDNLLKEKNHVSSELQILMTEKIQIEETVVLFKEQVESLKKVMKEMSLNDSALKSELVKATDDKVVLLKELDDIKREIVNVKKDNESSQQELFISRENCNTLTKENNAYESLINEMKSKNEELLLKYNEKIKENEQLDKNCLLFKAKLIKLKKQFDQKISSLTKEKEDVTQSITVIPLQKTNFEERFVPTPNETSDFGCQCDIKQLNVTPPNEKQNSFVSSSFSRDYYNENSLFNQIESMSEEVDAKVRKVNFEIEEFLERNERVTSSLVSRTSPNRPSTCTNTQCQKFASKIRELSITIKNLEEQNQIMKNKVIDLDGCLEREQKDKLHISENLTLKLNSFTTQNAQLHLQITHFKEEIKSLKKEKEKNSYKLSSLENEMHDLSLKYSNLSDENVRIFEQYESLKQISDSKYSSNLEQNKTLLNELEKEKNDKNELIKINKRLSEEAAEIVLSKQNCTNLTTENEELRKNILNISGINDDNVKRIKFLEDQISILEKELRNMEMIKSSMDNELVDSVSLLIVDLKKLKDIDSKYEKIGQTNQIIKEQIENILYRFEGLDETLDKLQRKRNIFKKFHEKVIQTEESVFNSLKTEIEDVITCDNKILPTTLKELKDQMVNREIQTEIDYLYTEKEMLNKSNQMDENILNLSDTKNEDTTLQTISKMLSPVEYSCGDIKNKKIDEETQTEIIMFSENSQTEDIIFDFSETKNEDIIIRENVAFQTTLPRSSKYENNSEEIKGKMINREIQTQIDSVYMKKIEEEERSLEAKIENLENNLEFEKQRKCEMSDKFEQIIIGLESACDAEIEKWKLANDMLKQEVFSLTINQKEQDNKIISLKQELFQLQTEAANMSYAEKAIETNENSLTWMENFNDALKQTISEKEDQITELIKQLTDISNENKSIHQNKELQQIQIENSNKTIERISQELREKEKTIEENYDVINEFEVIFVEKDNRINSLEKELSEINSQLEQYISAVCSMQARLEASKPNIESILNRSDSRSNNLQLLNLIDQLEKDYADELEQSESSKSKLEVKLNKAIQVIHKLKKQLKQSHSHILKLHEEIKLTKSTDQAVKVNRVDNKEPVIDNNESGLIDVSTQIDFESETDICKENVDYKGIIENLQVNNFLLWKELDTIRKTDRNVRGSSLPPMSSVPLMSGSKTFSVESERSISPVSQISSNSIEGDSLNLNKIKDLQRKNQRITQQLNQMRVERNRIHQEYTRIRQLKEEGDQRIAELLRQIDSNRNQDNILYEKDQLVEINNKYSTKIVELQAEIDMTTVRNSILETKCKKMEWKLNNQRRKYDQLVLKLDEKEQEIDRYSDEVLRNNSTFEKERLDWLREKKELKVSIKTKEEKILDFRKRLASKNRETDGKNEKNESIDYNTYSDYLLEIEQLRNQLSQQKLENKQCIAQHREEMIKQKGRLEELIDDNRQLKRKLTLDQQQECKINFLESSSSRSSGSLMQKIDEVSETSSFSLRNSSDSNVILAKVVLEKENLIQLLNDKEDQLNIEKQKSDQYQREILQLKYFENESQKNQSLIDRSTDTYYRFSNMDQIIQTDDNRDQYINDQSSQTSIDLSEENIKDYRRTCLMRLDIYKTNQIECFTPSYQIDIDTQTDSIKEFESILMSSSQISKSVSIQTENDKLVESLYQQIQIKDSFIEENQVNISKIDLLQQKIRESDRLISTLETENVEFRERIETLLQENMENESRYHQIIEELNNEIEKLREPKEKGNLDVKKDKEIGPSNDGWDMEWEYEKINTESQTNEDDLDNSGNSLTRGSEGQQDSDLYTFLVELDLLLNLYSDEILFQEIRKLISLYNNRDQSESLLKQHLSNNSNIISLVGILRDEISQLKQIINDKNQEVGQLKCLRNQLQADLLESGQQIKESNMEFLNLKENIQAINVEKTLLEQKNEELETRLRNLVNFNQLLSLDLRRLRDSSPITDESVTAESLIEEKSINKVTQSLEHELHKLLELMYEKDAKLEKSINQIEQMSCALQQLQFQKRDNIEATSEKSHQSADDPLDSRHSTNNDHEECQNYFAELSELLEKKQREIEELKSRLFLATDQLIHFRTFFTDPDYKLKQEYLPVSKLGSKRLSPFDKTTSGDSLKYHTRLLVESDAEDQFSDNDHQSIVSPDGSTVIRVDRMARAPQLCPNKFLNRIFGNLNYKNIHNHLKCAFSKNNLNILTFRSQPRLNIKTLLTIYMMILHLLLFRCMFL